MLERIGLFDEAIGIYSAILKHNPINQKIRSSLQRSKSAKLEIEKSISKGIQLFNKSEFEKVANQSQSLLKQHPDNILLLNMLGAALDAQGDLVNAKKAFKNSIAKKPDFADAHYNLGNVYKKLGDNNLAISSFQTALKFNPKYVAALNNLALVFQEIGDNENAISTYRKSLKLDPNNPETHNNIGVLLHDTEEFEQAAAAYRHALKLAPSYALAHKNLAVALETLDLSEQAIAPAETALELAPNMAEAHFVMGRIQRSLGDSAKAEESFLRSTELAPDKAEGYWAMGSAQKTLGKIVDAEANFRKALEIRPNYPSCMRNLSGIAKFRRDDPIINQMIALSSDESLSLQDKSHLNFALGYTFEQFKDYEKAFSYLKAGNAQRQEFLKYDFKQDEVMFENLRSAAEQFRAIDISGEIELANPAPLFIVGMPRSGTTLLEQIISSHSYVAGAGELNFASRYGMNLATGQIDITKKNVMAFRNAYLTAIQKFAEGHPIVSDKMPHNFRFVALLQCAFPEARIVHSKRDAGATCWSNFYQYFSAKGLGYCYGLKTVVAYYKLHIELMQFWNETFPGSVILSDYELLTKDQEAQTRELVKNLKLPWEDACLEPQKNKRAIKTASATQVRKAVYKGSSQKWLNYEPYLDGAFDELNSY